MERKLSRRDFLNDSLKGISLIALPLLGNAFAEDNSLEEDSERIHKDFLELVLKQGAIDTCYNGGRFEAENAVYYNGKPVDVYFNSVSGKATIPSKEEVEKSLQEFYRYGFNIYGEDEDDFIVDGIKFDFDYPGFDVKNSKVEKGKISVDSKFPARASLNGKSHKLGNNFGRVEIDSNLFDFYGTAKKITENCKGEFIVDYEEIVKSNLGKICQDSEVKCNIDSLVDSNQGVSLIIYNLYRGEKIEKENPDREIFRFGHLVKGIKKD